jgi:hypothetical protein
MITTHHFASQELSHRLSHFHQKVWFVQAKIMGSHEPVYYSGKIRDPQSEHSLGSDLIRNIFLPSTLFHQPLIFPRFDVTGD